MFEYSTLPFFRVSLLFEETLKKGEKSQGDPKKSSKAFFLSYAFSRV